MIIKNNLVKHVTLIEEKQSSHVLWMYFNKNAFGLPCILGAVYIPHEASKYHDNEIFDEIKEDVIRLKSSYDVPICLIGDFNSRTSTLDDFITLDEHISIIYNLDDLDREAFNSKQYFEKHGINTTRSNTDKCTNNNGYKLIELCKELDLKIVNGRLGDDRDKGDLTCSSKQGSSTVDYCIASSELFPYFDNFNVDVFDEDLSDVHSPICLSIRAYCKPIIVEEVTESITPGLDYKPVHTKWDPKLKINYQNKFDMKNISQLSKSLDFLLENGTNQSELEEKIKCFNKLCITPSVELEMSKEKNTNTSNKKRRKRKAHKPGFDEECVKKV